MTLSIPDRLQQRRPGVYYFHSGRQVEAKSSPTSGEGEAMRSFRLANIVILSCLISLGSALGQVSTATFYGIVTDSTRAVVPGAALTLTNTQTAIAYRKVSDSAGEFVFDFLPTGTYDLRIEAQGFKTNETKGITLNAGQQTRQTYTLEVGSVSETVSVAGTPPLLNAVSAEQQQSIEGSEVGQLPL